jgi:hypothetical protein
MKRVALSVMLAMSTIAAPTYGQTIEQIMDGTITLQQTDGFIGTLANGQTHHVIGPRLNFRVPTRTINVVSFTPPSLETGCNGTSFNLGNFSIISLDEAIALLRQIAAQSLNYAFGQALQAMCQPCWAGLNDLKKQLNAFNMNAKNTCAFAKAFVDDFDIDGKVESLTDEICTSKESALGEDSAVCKAAAGISNSYSGFITTLSGWNDTMTAAGGDIDSDFKGGNLMFEMYDRIDPLNRRFESMDIFKMFFGLSGIQPLLPWQIAASFYGTSGVMTNDEGTTIPFEGPSLPSIASLVSYKTNQTAGEDVLLKYYECAVAPVAGPLTPQCTNLTKVDINQNIGLCAATANFAADSTAVTNKTFNDYLNCEIEEMLTAFNDGTIFAAAATNNLLRKHMLSLLNKREQRALIYATTEEFQLVKAEVSTALTAYIEATILFEVFNDFHQNHLNIAQIARKKIKGMDAALKQFDSRVILINDELLGLRDKKFESYEKLKEITSWQELAKKYEEDIADGLSSLASGR